MDNTFISKYIYGEWKKSPGVIIKGILLLIPIISIVGLFSTVFAIEAVNQNSFLKNSDYDWIAYYDKESSITPELESPFLVLNNQAIAHIISFSPTLWYSPQTSIELFIVEDVNPSNWSNTYFNKANLLSGSYEDLSKDGDSLGIILSYNAAKSLNKDVGDTAHILIHDIPKENTDEDEDELPGTLYYPVTIKGILKPFIPIDQAQGGLGLALANDKFISLLNEHQDSHETNYRYAVFGVDDPNFNSTNEIIYKNQQKIRYFHRNNYIIALAISGALVVYLLINRELEFILKMRMRDIGILLALGSKKETIIKALWLEQILKIGFASFISSLIYKYLIVDLFLGQYVSLRFMLVLFLIYMSIGWLSIKIAMREIKTSIRELSISDIVSKMPEEM